MTTYDLGASATYHETGDMVVVTIYLLDPTEGPAGTYKPQLVKSANCSLISGNTVIDTSVYFDLRFGTSEGNFQVFFLHPSSIHHLKVHIAMTVIDDTVEDYYEFDTHVIRIEAEDMGLDAQPWEEDED